jgi:hypothetical protein
MRIEDRNVLSFVMEVFPERIFWFLGFELAIKVFSGIEENVLKSVQGNLCKNKKGANPTITERSLQT